jgi:hypothetical protein
MMRPVAAGSSRLGVVVIAATCLVASQARAHPLVDEARAQADRADFGAALATLDRAEAAEDLDLAALEELLLLRALASIGLGREADARRDLRRLAAIAPELVLPDTVAPAIRDELERVRRSVTAVTIDVQVEDHAGAVEVQASAAGEEGVVREVRLSARERGSAWASAAVARGSATASVRVPSRGGAIEARVAAIGPGGAVVAERGTEAEPLLVREGRVVPADVLDGEDEDDGEGSGALWPIVGAGAAVVVIGTVVAVILIGSSSSSGGSGDGGAFGAPTVVWP